MPRAPPEPEPGTSPSRPASGRRVALQGAVRCGTEQGCTWLPVGKRLRRNLRQLHFFLREQGKGRETQAAGSTCPLGQGTGCFPGCPRLTRDTRGPSTPKLGDACSAPGGLRPGQSLGRAGPRAPRSSVYAGRGPQGGPCWDVPRRRHGGRPGAGLAVPRSVAGGPQERGTASWAGARRFVSRATRGARRVVGSGARTLPAPPAWRRWGWDGTLGRRPRAQGALAGGQAPTSGTGRVRGL